MVKVVQQKQCLAMAKDNDLTYRIVAPTGKAAARVREITGEHASTIHKLCLSEIYINCDLLLVDESSYDRFVCIIVCF